MQRRGAIYGQGEGLQGDSYALPTCDYALRPLLLGDIQLFVDRFLAFARTCPETLFQVTRVGCGLAGYTDAQIAPLFLSAPDNVWLPSAWLRAVAP